MTAERAPYPEVAPMGSRPRMRHHKQEPCHPLPAGAPPRITGMRINAASIRDIPETIETLSKKNRNIYEKMSTFLKTHLYLQWNCDLYIRFLVR
jgi:hypothetical protein